MRQCLFLCLVLVLVLVVVEPIPPSSQPLPESMLDCLLENLKIFSNLEFADVMSVMAKESRGDVTCKTWEPTVNEFSYGPLQILGSTARTKGYKGDLDDLCSWKYGLYYGMAFLSDCKDRAIRMVEREELVKPLTRQEKERKIRAHMYAIYNAGRVRWKKGHEGKRYANHDYVVECEYLYWRYKKFDLNLIPRKSFAFTQSERW